MTEASTTRLAELATSLTRDTIPEPVRRVARWGILDAVACAIAGANEPVATATRQWLASDGAEGPATLWGTTARAPASAAALANGTAAHALDFDDVCWAMNAHPSVVLAPAVIAAAEALQASGADVLHAYVVGFEVAARVGEAMSTPHYAAGFHPTSTIGTLAAATAVGILRGQDPATLAQGLGIAVSSAAGTRQNFGTDTKALHAGLAARAGLTAASLASAGVSARADALEGPMGFVALYRGASRDVDARPGRWALLDPGLEHKPYPCCRFTHRVVEAVTRLRGRHPGASLAAMQCRVDPFSREILIYDRAESGLQAKFSMQVAAALAWLDGSPTAATFADERVRAEDVRSLSRRVELVDGSSQAETVTVTFDDGATDSETITVPLGHPGRPLSREAHVEKVHGCADEVLGATQIRELIAAFEDIESATDVRELTRLLRPAV